MFEACYSFNNTPGVYQKCLVYSKSKYLTLSKSHIELHETNQYDANDKMLKAIMLTKVAFIASGVIAKGKLLCLWSSP
jgi:hypothetical protein